MLHDAPALNLRLGVLWVRRPKVDVPENVETQVAPGRATRHSVGRADGARRPKVTVHSRGFGKMAGRGGYPPQKCPLTNGGESPPVVSRSVASPG